jgi:hypothetical protein
MRTQKSDSSKTAPYGRQHARTAELYRQRREQRARAQQLAAEPPPPDMMAAPTNTMEPPKEAVEQQPAMLEETPKPAHKARQAVESVLQVAREAHPLASARKLAGTVVTGAVRVAREVSARARKAKGPGKKA